MAATGRRADPPLERDDRFKAAHRFDFFQAVRLLHRALPERAPVGYLADPRDEVVRFHSRIGLDFPASAVDEMTQAPDGRVDMHVNIMGLAGPLGVLPRHYTDLALQRLRGKDTALRDFLDIFNHRLISLFYRAWEKHNLPVSYERMRVRRAAGVAEDDAYDHLSLHLLELIGLASQLLRRRLRHMDLHSSAPLYFAGLLAQQPRSASALRGVLEEYFGVDVLVVQFTGQWLPVAVEDRTRIGTYGTNALLGDDAFAGDQVWDQQAKFRLRLGPVSFVRFCSFLPSGGAFRPLVMLTRLFVGQEYDFEIQLVLLAAEVPPCVLGDRGEASARLGWSAWLKTGPFTADADAVILRGRATMEGVFPS